MLWVKERPDNSGQMPADLPVEENAVAVHKDLSGCAHWKKVADGIGLRWSASTALGGKRGGRQFANGLPASVFAQ